MATGEPLVLPPGSVGTVILGSNAVDAFKDANTLTQQAHDLDHFIMPNIVETGQQGSDPVE